VGSDSPAADFEILLMMRNTLMAIGAGDLIIRLNHRGLFNRFLSHIGVREGPAEILRIVDKIAKIGREAVLEQLTETAGTEAARRVLAFIESRGSYGETLAAITEAAGGGCPESERLEAIRRFMTDAGVEDSFVLDPSITRGLDYYTGVVYETFLKDLPGIGSVCSGGRYDNLAGLYSREPITGVGASIGLDRLIAALEGLGKTGGAAAYALAAVACVREASGGVYQRLAGLFRERGIPCEVFPEAKKITQQFILAEKKGIPWVIVPGEDPLGGPLTLRDIGRRQSREVSGPEEAAAVIGAGEAR
jgi:histidyl-tRNA synthetase